MSTTGLLDEHHLPAISQCSMRTLRTANNVGLRPVIPRAEDCELIVRADRGERR
jgi:hypothetical protein